MEYTRFKKIPQLKVYKQLQLYISNKIIVGTKVAIFYIGVTQQDNKAIHCAKIISDDRWGKL